MPGYTSKRWFFSLILGAVSGLLYANTIRGDFVYDDRAVIINNPQIRYWHFWDLWEVMGRSVRTLSLMIDYHLFGDSPTGYHFQNILWHLLSVLLLYLLFEKISKDRSLSFFGALIFAAHPIHVEAVANIANRKETLCMFFSLLSFVFYLRFIDGRDRKRWLWFSASLAGWYIALNSKQVAAVLPLSFAAYEGLFLARERRFLTKSPALFYAGAVLAGVAGVLYIVNYVEFSKGSFVGDATLFSSAINSARTLIAYIMLLLFPLSLAPDHIFKLSASIADPVVILSWIAVSGVIALPFILALRDPLISFGLFWFLIHYIPVSAIVPGAYFIADRYMYIPSAGFCLVFASLGKRVYNVLLYSHGEKLAAGIATAIGATILAGYSVKTVTYNSFWLQEKSLWEYTLNLYPDSHVAYRGRGFAYHNSGKYDEAIEDYSRAIQLNPAYDDAYYNRGIAYDALEDYGKAIDDYSMAIRLNHKYVNAYINRGSAYNSLGEYRLAIKDLNRAIDIKPDNAAAYNNRGTAFGGLGEQLNAIKDYNRAVELDPQNEKAYYNRGNAYNNLGKTRQAIEDYSRAIDINPEYAKAYYNRGIAYGSSGNHGKAVDDLNRAIDLDPQNELAYYNRGISYGILGSYEQAIKDFNRAVELDLEYAEAYNSRGTVYYESGDFDLAINDYNRAIEIKPGYAEVYYNLGLAYSRIGNVEKASIHYRKAADLGLERDSVVSTVN